MLAEFQRETLRVLAMCSSGSGFDVKWISHYSQHPYCKHMPRARSGTIASDLKELERAGFVRRLDSDKPIVWAITDDGRKALTG